MTLGDLSFEDRRLPDAPPKTPPRRRSLALAGVGLAVLAVLLALYAARRTIAREALTAWLRSRGVSAAAEVQALGPSGVTGSVVVGDPHHPDFAVQQVEVGYGLTASGLEIRSVRLVRPELRASWRGGRFSAGALDPLIEALSKGPPQPNAPKPRITVEGGRVQLATDFGVLAADVDAVVAQGRLARLAARVAPTQLRGRDFAADLGPAALNLQSFGARAELSLDAPLIKAAAGRLAILGGRVAITAAGPYPDAAWNAAPQPVAAHAELSGGRIAVAGQALDNRLIAVALTGSVSGGLQDLDFTGRANADLRAAGGRAAGGTAGPLHAALTAEDLRWTRRGGAARAILAASASLERFDRGDTRLDQTTAAMRGPVAWDGRDVTFRLTASAAGHGGLPGLGRAAPGDAADFVALRRAARSFRFAAPGVAFEGAGGRLAVRLPQPAQLAPDAGGKVTLAAAGTGWRLTAAGGGLPKLDAEIRRVALTPGGAVASGRIRAALSLGLVQGGEVDATGTLRIANGEASFEGGGCAQLAAARLDFGGNDVTQLHGRLCPAALPLIQLSRGDWRIVGRAEAVAGEVAFLQARFAEAAGPVAFGARSNQLEANARIAAAVSDSAAQTRFRPVEVAGQAQLARGIWTSDLAIRDAAGRPIAQARLTHAAATGRGGMQIATGALRFAPGGLQPAALSPLAASIGSPAEGEARFSGDLAWTPKTATSSGVLEIPRLDFQSPAGKVSGLSGRVAFSSLAPLTAAPGQTLHAEAIATPVAPLTDARATFGLRAEALEVAQAQAAAGGGLVGVENLEVPLNPGQPIRGVLHLDGVQLHDLIAASPFGDKVDLEARVSGSLPFTVQGEKVRISGGSLHAVQPGRLSIQRAALSAPAAAAGPPPAAAADPFSDFAYQAMENLAFTTLTASVDSRPDGRLGMVFHVIGRHDPPQRQAIRIPFSDLIGRKFLNRKLPLPSGTGVDLTLDTTLNLDDLLGDYADFRRLHGSASVHP